MLGCLVAFLLGGPVLAQQVCDTRSYPLSSPTSRFADNADGTVTDMESKLMWTRCSAGQVWAGGTCSGMASRHTWQAAQGVARDVNQRGTYFYTDWRLPLLREIATITERQCRSPRINLAVFPDTPVTQYWTASSRSGPQAEGFAFAIGMGADGVEFQDKDQANMVRLVRNAR
jgi:cation transport regulator ChaC